MFFVRFILIFCFVECSYCFSCEEAMELLKDEGTPIESCTEVGGNPIVSYSRKTKAVSDAVNCETIPDAFAQRGRPVTDCVEVGGSAFFRVDKIHDWKSAWVICQGIPGGHLATINNLKEFRAMSDLIESMNHGITYNVWLGLNKNSGETLFRWSEDGSVANYTKLLASEAGTAAGPSCVYATRNNGHYNYFLGNTGWGEMTCTTQYMPICQIAVNPPSQ